MQRVRSSTLLRSKFFEKAPSASEHILAALDRGEIIPGEKGRVDITLDTAIFGASCAVFDTTFGTLSYSTDGYTVLATIRNGVLTNITLSEIDSPQEISERALINRHGNALVTWLASGGLAAQLGHTNH